MFFYRKFKKEAIARLESERKLYVFEADHWMIKSVYKSGGTVDDVVKKFKERDKIIDACWKRVQSL